MVPESVCPTWGWRSLLLFVSLWAAGCAPPGRHEMLNAVLWQQHAAEYRAVALQTYALAAARLDEALDDPSWSAALEQTGGGTGLPPAVILDLDETVFDNGPYEARIVTQLGEYSPASFARWCESETPGAVPGAVEFISMARKRGVQVFFYTARREELAGCTVRSLKALGLGDDVAGSVFLRGAGSKSEVRARLARTHRILLLVGDNLEDFVDGSKSTPAARVNLVQQHAGWFGRRWIVLPNPVYGHWEAAYYGFDYDVPRHEKVQSKRKALSP